MLWTAKQIFINVGVCYRPPDDNAFLDQLDNALTDISP